MKGQKRRFIWALAVFIVLSIADYIFETRYHLDDYLWFRGLKLFVWFPSMVAVVFTWPHRNH
ncbi:hypothetical protein [Lacticaseibacillus brantae]|uniref:Uncharacterized protein n=1 Tax=Lacticaseibacillus brantae DSM 23927 TaxID=1423727 RepID=A0A0R2B7D4_9LACO|nr:hypothetical protein [Lacticaseibacillus brantae]KRM72217.1 hypothetical protein FC34_GL001202 [Lacticaseibacillus brantae DSM 23927]